jgi:hypothetical protein
MEHFEQLGEYESGQVRYVRRNHDKLIGLAAQLMRHRRYRDIGRKMQRSRPQQLGNRGRTRDARSDVDQIGHYLV